MTLFKTPFDKAKSVLIYKPWTNKQADELIRLVNLGRRND